MAHVITLTRELTSRQVARRHVPKDVTDTDIVLNAGAVATASPGAADELVKALLGVDAHRVIVVNASPSFQRLLHTVHRARTRPERTFLLVFREVGAEALLRAV